MASQTLSFSWLDQTSICTSPTIIFLSDRIFSLLCYLHAKWSQLHLYLYIEERIHNDYQSRQCGDFFLKWKQRDDEEFTLISGYNLGRSSPHIVQNPWFNSCREEICIQSFEESGVMLQVRMPSFINWWMSFKRGSNCKMQEESP